MKRFIGISLFWVCSFIHAHDFPSTNGLCLFNNKKAEPCIIENGGGAGGTYVSLISKQHKIYIETECSANDKCTSSIGPNSEELYPAKEYTYNGWFCTKEIKKNNNLNGCFKLK